MPFIAYRDKRDRDSKPNESVMEFVTKKWLPCQPRIILCFVLEEKANLLSKIT